MKIDGSTCGKQSVQLSTPDVSGCDCFGPRPGLPGVSHMGIKSLCLWHCERGEGPLIIANVGYHLWKENLQFEKSIPYMTRPLWANCEKLDNEHCFALFILSKTGSEFNSEVQ